MDCSVLVLYPTKNFVTVDFLHPSRPARTMEPRRLAALLVTDPDSLCSSLHSSESVTEDECDSMEHWIERDWADALPYHLASNNVSFIDNGPRAQVIREQILASYLQNGPAPERLPIRGELVDLPRPLELPTDMKFGCVLLGRRTTRRFLSLTISLEALSSWLWYGFHDIRSTRSRSITEGSLGLLRSFGVAFDPYLVVYRNTALDCGVYRYDPSGHVLFRISVGENSRTVAEACQSQLASLSAALTLVLVIDFDQYLWRYRHERSLRNLYVESGRVAQSLILAGEAFGLGFFLTPAIREPAFVELLDLKEPRQYPLYVLTCGGVVRAWHRQCLDK